MTHHIIAYIFDINISKIGIKNTMRIIINLIELNYAKIYK